MPALKYVIEDWDKKKLEKNPEIKNPTPKKTTSQVKGIFDLFKEYLKKEIPPKAYSSNRGEFIRIFSTKDEIRKHKIWFNKISNHTSAGEINEANKNLISQLNIALDELWEEHNQK